jgi:hypothetical protein
MIYGHEDQNSPFEGYQWKTSATDICYQEFGTRRHPPSVHVDPRDSPTPESKTRRTSSQRLVHLQLFSHNQDIVRCQGARKAHESNLICPCMDDGASGRCRRIQTEIGE